jgi:hypothetical protein
VGAEAKDGVIARGWAPGPETARDDIG